MYGRILWLKLTSLCSNLGPYKHPLDIHIFTIRKHQVQLAGKVLLPLPTMQRNKPVEGWFEMRPPEFVIKKGHLDCLGELNLRVMAKEDIALPYQAYSSLGSVSLTQVMAVSVAQTNLHSTMLAMLAVDC